jgi:hypothetical protein
MLDKFGKGLTYFSRIITVVAIVVVGILAFKLLFDDSKDAGEARAKVASDVEDAVESVTDSKYVTGAKGIQLDNGKTVGEAFKDFFGEPDWTTGEMNGFKYAIFNGTSMQNSERVTVTIYFKADTNDSTIKMDRMEINGEPQNDLILAGLLQSITASDSDTTQVSDEPSRTEDDILTENELLQSVSNMPEMDNVPMDEPILKIVEYPSEVEPYFIVSAGTDNEVYYTIKVDAFTGETLDIIEE